MRGGVIQVNYDKLAINNKGHILRMIFCFNNTSILNVLASYIK